MKQKTLREDAHSREAETCRKRLRETPECAKAHSFSYRTEMRVTYMKRLAVGILAHVDAGKTTLSEAMLYAGGMIRHLGRVDKGDAFLDTYELEKKRGITIFSKQARLAWDDMDVTLLDTPGHVDFSAEMERVLQVLDYAVLVIRDRKSVV